MVRVVNLQVDTSGDMAVAEQSYQAAQRLLGITDSYMGRQDRTATSGTAKQIAVAQSAGQIGKQTHHEKFYVCGFVSGHV